MIFDPSYLSIEDLFRGYFSRTGGLDSMVGQYRSQIFPASEEQAEVIRGLLDGSRVPMAVPGSREARFWPAEAYHQKHQLRRNAELVAAMADELGPRWDEHVYATKLNAVGARGFDVSPWLAETPPVIADAFKRSR